MKNKKIYALISLFLPLILIFATTTVAFADEWDYESEYDWGYEDWDSDWNWDDDSGVYVNPVTKITFSNIKYNSATVNWNNPGDIDGYDIYRLSYIDTEYESGWQKELLTTIDNPNTLSYRMTGLVPVDYYDIAVVPYKFISSVKYSAETFDCTDSFSTPFCMSGKFYTSNAKGAKAVTKVLKGYKENQKFKGAGQCYGYAEWASKKIAKTRTKVNINKKITLKNIKKYIIGLKPGAHVRMTSKRMDHSVLILKATKDRVYWADNNWGGNNRVHYHAGSVEEFYYMASGYTKLSFIIKTKSYR